VKRVVLFAVCAIAATGAAAEWHYLSGGKLSGISSVGSHVWAVGQDGLMFHSVDNGESWRRVPRFTTRNLTDVDLQSTGLGVVTTDGPFVFRTTDLGATWDSTALDTPCSRVRFINDNLVVMNGHWCCRRSDSAGRAGTWRSVSGPGEQIFLFDSVYGWDGYAGNVFRSRNGGSSWNHIAYAPNWLDRFCFADTSFGVSHCWWETGGRPPETWYGWQITSNGGLRWDVIGNSSSADFDIDTDGHGRLLGALGETCYVLSRQGNIRVALPGGTTCLSIDAGGEERVWACGYGAAIWSSSDSGKSWVSVRPQSLQHLLTVDFCDGVHGWGTSIDWAGRTTDAGRSWTRTAAKPGISNISDVAAISESVCLIAAGWTSGDFVHGYWGKFGLERTVDAGASWDTIHFKELGGDDVPIGSSRFSHVDRRIWHAGTRTPSGNSLRSTDDGTTWLDMDTVCTTGEGEPPDISFVDTLHGWVIDSRQNVRVTNNSGDSWTIIATGLNAKRLKMTGLTTGWAISDSVLYQTADGGVNWQSVMTQPGLQAIAFCDSSRGAIVGKKGLIIRTSDAGETWVRDSSDFTSDLYDVCMLDSTHAWAVGANGLVLGFGEWAIGVDEARGNEGPYTRTAAVAVRPNPCRGRATVEFSRPIARPTQVVLVDAAGRVIQVVPARLGARSLDLDVRGMPSGIYFVRACAGPAARLVVQH
jgi:photosystem II stability/assembly factor-like uncharacterized protein